MLSARGTFTKEGLLITVGGEELGRLLTEGTIDLSCLLDILFVSK